MGAHRQYCAECFGLFDAASDVCPRCGAVASRLSEREYDKKLLHALEHPLADVRLRAVIALGRRAQAGAANALAQCALRHPGDVVQALEIVDCLFRITQRHPASADALKRLADEHPARVVRETAATLLRKAT